MAETLLTASIGAPGFMGVNTQDSSVSLEAGFATKAHNCVIDKFGRIGARQGWAAQHTANNDLSTANVSAIGELIAQDGTSYVIAAGNGCLFKLVGTTLTKLTYGGGGSAPTIGDNNWQMAPLNGVLYLYQSGHDPLVFDPAVSTTTFRRVSEKTGYLGTVQQSACAISAYGRIWSASTASNKSLIQFSDLEAGHVLTTGTSGTLDVSAVWPNGSDEIIALAAHNNSLIIFGRRQILVYKGARDPSSMSLEDTVNGIGCCARDSVALTGSDVFFLSDSGVRSFARTIQEKSAPMRDISSNVRDDLVNNLNVEALANIKAVYSDTNAFYLLSFPVAKITYCFDTRKALQDGSARVTTWSIYPRAMFSTRAKSLLMGFAGYIGKYSTNLDNATKYRFQYYTNYFDLSKPSVMKILKKISFTCIGGANATLTLKYAFDYSGSYVSRQVTIGNIIVAEYGIAEYGLSEYTTGIVFDNQRVQASGSGSILQLGIETEVNNFDLSIQKLDVFCKEGRTQ
jgi:hypothetical protein